MRVLITGATGQLGPWLIEALANAGTFVIPWPGRSHGGIDLRDAAAVAEHFAAAKPDVVVHAAALAKPTDAFKDPPLARAINVDATRTLAQLSAAYRARFIYLSTDMVFNGQQGSYRETDPATPASIYGQTKLEAESIALDSPLALVIRLSLLFGPSKTAKPTLFDEHAAALRAGKTITVFTDEWRTPLSLAAAAKGIATAAHSSAHGLFHLGGPQRVNRAEFAALLAAELHADPALLRPVSRLSIDSPEPRPRDTSLDSTKWHATFPTPPVPLAAAIREAMK